MISPYKFSWNQFSSLEFDLITDLAFDSDQGTIETHLSREAVASEVYNGSLKRVSGYKWNNSFTFQLTLIKNNFGNFTDEENRRILTWLTSSDEAGFIDIYKDDSDVVEYSVLGNIVNISQYKLGNSRVVGYVVDFESCMPYAVSDLYTVAKTVTNATDNKIVINIDTDDNKPVYPRVVIKHNGSVVRIPTGTELNTYSDMIENTVYYNGSKYFWKSAGKMSGSAKPNYDWEVVPVSHAYTDADTWENNKIYYYAATKTYYWIEPYFFKSDTVNPNLTTTSVKLTNKHTDYVNRIQVLPSVVVKNNNSTETVTLDGANQLAYSSSVNRVIDNDFVNWTWLALLNGTNEITVEGNCTVTLEWREVRKVGAW